MIGRKYHIEDLKSLQFTQKFQRRDFCIAIIDDEEELPIKDILERHDFVITHFHDIKSIKEIQGFDIIICDINGVGETLEAKYGGAYIVKEIVANYPQKYVIISSGSMFEVDFNEYFKLADKYLKKGADSSDWIEVLDNAIQELNSPLFFWERIRAYLKKNKIEPKIINDIEQNYIKSLLKKDSRYLQKSISKIPNEYASFAINTLISFSTSLLSNMVTL